MGLRGCPSRLLSRRSDSSEGSRVSAGTVQAPGQGVALWQLQICVFGALLARFLDEEPESEPSGNLSQTLTSGPKCSPEGEGSASFTHPSSLHPPALPEPPQAGLCPRLSPEQWAGGQPALTETTTHPGSEGPSRRLCWRLGGEADGPAAAPGLGGCGHSSREQLVDPEASEWGRPLGGKVTH